MPIRIFAAEIFVAKSFDEIDLLLARVNSALLRAVDLDPFGAMLSTGWWVYVFTPLKPKGTLQVVELLADSAQRVHHVCRRATAPTRQ